MVICLSLSDLTALSVVILGRDLSFSFFFFSLLGGRIWLISLVN